MVLSATRSTVSKLSARIRCLRLNRPDHFSRRSGSSRLVEAISDPVERIDRVETRVDGAELAPDALDVAVDGAVVDIDIIAIGDVEQLVARFYDAWPLGERFQDHELGHGQANDPSVPQYLVPSWVHDEATSLKSRRFRLEEARRCFAALQFLPPQDGADPGDQQTLRKWFRNIVVGAHGEAQRLVELMVLGGEKEHGDGARFSEPPPERPSVPARHLVVEHAA